MGNCGGQHRILAPTHPLLPCSMNTHMRVHKRTHTLGHFSFHTKWMNRWVKALSLWSVLKLPWRRSALVYLAAAAAAKSLQSCPTLCDPIDGSPPGPPVPGILQARTLEWVAIAFSNAGKRKVKVKLLSPIQLFATPWTATYQAPPSMGFSRQEYWSVEPLPSPCVPRWCAYDQTRVFYLTLNPLFHKWKDWGHNEVTAQGHTTGALAELRWELESQVHQSDDLCFL